MDSWGGFRMRPGSPSRSHEERLEAASNAVGKLLMASPERETKLVLMSPISTLAGPLDGDISPITSTSGCLAYTPPCASHQWHAEGPLVTEPPHQPPAMHADIAPPWPKNPETPPTLNLQTHFSPGFTIWKQEAQLERGEKSPKERLSGLYIETGSLLCPEGVESNPAMSTSTGLEGPPSQSTFSQDEFDHTFFCGPNSRSASPQSPLDAGPPCDLRPGLAGVLDRSVSFAAWGMPATTEEHSEATQDGNTVWGVAALLEEASQNSLSGKPQGGAYPKRSGGMTASDEEAGAWAEYADEFVDSEEEGPLLKPGVAFEGWATKSIDLGEGWGRAGGNRTQMGTPALDSGVVGDTWQEKREAELRDSVIKRRARNSDQAFGSWDCSDPKFGAHLENSAPVGRVGSRHESLAELLCNEDDLLCMEVGETEGHPGQDTDSEALDGGHDWRREQKEAGQNLGFFGRGRDLELVVGVAGPDVARGEVTDHMDVSGGPKSSGSIGVKRSESEAELDDVDTSVGGPIRCANVRTPEKSPQKRTKAKELGASLDCWLPFKQLVGEAAALGGGENVGENNTLPGERVWSGVEEIGVPVDGTKAGELPDSSGKEPCLVRSEELVPGTRSGAQEEQTPEDSGGQVGVNDMDEGCAVQSGGVDHTSSSKDGVLADSWGSPSGAPLSPVAIPLEQSLEDSPPVQARFSPLQVPPSPSPKPRASHTRESGPRAGGPLSPGAKNRYAAGLKKAQGLIGQEGLQGGLPHRKPPRARQWSVKNGVKSLQMGRVEELPGVVRKRRGFGPLGLLEKAPPFSSETFLGGWVEREKQIRTQVRKLTPEEKTNRVPAYPPWNSVVRRGGFDPPQSLSTSDVSDDVISSGPGVRDSSELSTSSSGSFRIRSNARLVRNSSDARSSFRASPGAPGGSPGLTPMPEDSGEISEGSKQSYGGAVVPVFGRGEAMDSPETPQVQVAAEEGDEQCPEAPTGRHKMTRQGSLMETKLLMTTALKRTQSSFLFDKHFEFLKVIGRGSYSTVYQARDRRSGGLCAIKKSKREFKGRDDRERYLHEIQSVACLSEHPNVVKYYRGWQQDGHFFIQMELCEGGNLKDWTDSQSGPLEEDQIWSWVRQIAAGLQYLHSKCVLHLDIKPDNIFLDSGGTLKIGDFGLAVLRRQWEWEEGDGAYVAPELLREHEPGPEADMYSFGAMIFEWATGRQLPRSGPERQGDVDLSDTRSDALNRLVRSLLSGRPEERPSAEQVVGMGPRGGGI